MMKDKLEWFYSPEKESVTDEWGFMIADVFGYDMVDRDFNGRLIEAAPMLYYAVKELNRRVHDLHALFNIPVDEVLDDIDNFVKSMMSMEEK